VPHLAAWYKRCFDASTAVQKVWKGELQLCDQTVVDPGKKGKPTKNEMKAREKAKKKEKAAAKKAEGALEPASSAPAAAGEAQLATLRPASTCLPTR
jgi:hypothetical protein